MHRNLTTLLRAKGSNQNQFQKSVFYYRKNLRLHRKKEKEAEKHFIKSRH